jgi:hypothetical protein
VSSVHGAGDPTATSVGGHLEIAALIDARDGRAGERVRVHLAACATCRAQLEATHQLRARLRALPAVPPPRDRWPEVRRGIVAVIGRRRRRQVLSALAVAAGLIALLWSGMAISERSARQRESARLRAHLAELREQSQLLDAELRNLATRATSSAQAEALILLQDGLERIDAELAGGPEVPSAPELEPEELVDRIALLSRRLELQGVMVQVHHAPLRIGAL